MFRGQGTRTVNTEDDLLIDRLRAAWQAPAVGPPPADHPDPEKIWDAAAGRLAPEVTARLVDHLALCAECAEEWRLALALEREKLDDTAGSGTVVPLPLRPARSSWWDPRWAAAAALLVGALGFAVFLPKSPPADDPGYRGTGDRPVPDASSPAAPSATGSFIESLVRDNAPVTRKGFKLAWKPVQGAVSYDLSIRTSGLDTVVQVSGLTATEYEVPAEKLTKLRPASHLVWQVEAVFPDGTRSPRPPTFRLTLEE
jgi:hypothetical protein